MIEQFPNDSNDSCSSVVPAKKERSDYDHERHLARMRADQFVCNLIGIHLDDANVGYARASLKLEPIHLNGVGIAQGGVLFTLADYAFAAACNYSEEEVVGIETNMSFIKAAHAGNTIIAIAKEVFRSRSFAGCEVIVQNETGQLLARFNGRGYILKQS